MADITHVVGNESTSSYSEPVYPGNPSEYYDRLKSEVGEEVVEKLNPILGDLTVDQLRCLERYIGECCRQMSKQLEKTVTMADFEAVKKMDVDGDNEEGETEEGEEKE